jgi:hypothetical protein
MRYLVFLLSLLIFYSCKETIQAPDVSGQQVDFNFYRMDQKIFSLKDKETLTAALINIQSEHPPFYNVFFNHVFPVGPASNTDSLATAILEYNKQPLSDTLLKMVQNKYADMKPIEDEFRKTFQYAKYYFPDLSSPDVYTYISEFAIQGFIFEGNEGKDAIGVGLDMYLSDIHEYKKMEPDNPGFSDYITRSWNKDHLVKKAIDVWLSDFVEPTNGNKLLDYMISNGKKLYIMKHLMPEVHDSIIMEYSAEDMAWCEDNEIQMWSFFTEKNLLQESNPGQINKYINPSPDSPGMPSEAPGRTGNYIGYKIVKAFMDKNDKMPFMELATYKDTQKLFEDSRYKPKRK